jgi:hypothetical protein
LPNSGKNLVELLHAQTAGRHRLFLFATSRLLNLGELLYDPFKPLAILRRDVCP